MKKISLALLFAAGPLWFGMASLCSATTFTVVNLNDSGAGSLRQAILTATNGDNIVFVGGLSGTIVLSSGVLQVNQSVNISGPGPQVLSVSGGGLSGVFAFGSSSSGVFTNSLSGLTITNGNAQFGGGVVSYAVLTVSNCVFTGNKAGPSSGNGGALAVFGPSAILNSTISGNEATGVGGGIEMTLHSGTRLSLINCTVCSNICDSAFAGAIDISSALYMTNCTVIGNQSTAGSGIGGLSQFNGSTVMVANSIIAGNTSAGRASDVLGTNFTSLGYNFVGCTNGGTGFGRPGSEDLTGSTASPIDPSLGPLQLNGGQTPTMALLPGSPVIDQGMSFGIKTDQRGRSRPYVDPYITEPPGGDGSDIGAYEVNPTSLLVLNKNDSGPGSLRQILQNAGGSDYDTITFATTVKGTITLTSGPLAVDKTLSINGPGASVLTLSGNNNSRIFSITGKNTQLFLYGLSLVQARSGDGCLLVSTNTAVNLDSCTVRSNACAGIYNQGLLQMDYSAVVDNTNSGPGGGIANLHGDVDIADSTISGNSATLGGGMYLNGGSLFLYNSTIVSNNTIAAGIPSRQGGGIDIITAPALPPVVQSSIIANNSANQGPDVLGTFNSSGYNLIGIGDGSAGFTNDIHQDQVGSAGTPLDPLLGPLQNNGGPTPTHAPLSGSPAVDQGLDVLQLTTDQRNLPRTVDIACATNAIGGDGTDIGAVEADSSYTCPCNCSTTLVVDVSQTLRTVDARWFGVNAAVWDSHFDTPETLSALEEMGCRTLRFPGGSTSDDYHWTSNISGTNNFVWRTATSNFMDIATNLAANVFITANYGSGTTNEAADWVRYVNQTNHCHFQYWEIGNECYGSWETDRNTNAPWQPHDPWTYAMRFRDYFTAMKSADPTIKIGAVAIPGEDNAVLYTNHPAFNPRTGQTHYGWTPVMLSTLQSLGVTPDFIVEHFYPEYLVDSDPILLQVATNWAADAADLRQQIKDYFGGGGTNIELVCTENNSDAGPQGRQSTSLVNGLYLADSLSQIMKTGFNSFIWWDLRNGVDTNGDFDPSLYGWRTNGDLGIMVGANERYPTFYALKLIQYFAQPGDTILNPTGGDPLLAVYAARKTSGALSLLVINKNRTNTLTRQIILAGFVPNSVATVRSYGIAQDEAARTNAPLAAQDIATETLSSAAPSFSYSFPPYSLTLFMLTPPGAPSLIISLTMTNTAVISWPDTGAYTLQTNGNLSTTNWAAYGGVVTTTNNTNSVSITPPTGDLFFRLNQ